MSGRALLFSLAAFLLSERFVIAQGVPAPRMEEQSLRTAVDAYRKSWEAMPPDQRRKIVDAGGMTPERYEQMLRGASAAPSANSRTAPPQPASADNVGDMVRSTTTDLDVVRDANLARVRDESCPAETALSIAALRSRVTPGAMPSRAAMLELAATWNNRNPAALKSNASTPAEISAAIEQLLSGCKR